MLGRICAKKAGVKSIIYQAHGFHFYKGAPLKNWMIYYPVENLLSRYTDLLITIAKDDYELAQKMRAKQVKYVHGVGIDVNNFRRRADFDKNQPLRKSLNIQDGMKVLLSVGELNHNKNHFLVLQALRNLNFDIVYIICGDGILKQKYEEYIKDNNLEKRVYLVGFRPDVKEFYRAADLFIFPSLREGIPSAVMEAIATGVPVITSDIRGVRDLIKDKTYRFSPSDSYALAKLIKDTLIKDNSSAIKSNINNLTPYLFDNVVNELKNIYADMIKDCINN